MPALDPETRERWRDLVVIDRDAATVGPITMFYLDRASGLPTWALVHTGWFGDRQTFVPLANAVEVDGEIRVPYARSHIRQAPQFPAAAELTPDEELALYGHYGLHDHHGAVAERAPEAEPDAGPGWRLERDEGPGPAEGRVQRPAMAEGPGPGAAQGPRPGQGAAEGAEGPGLWTAGATESGVGLRSPTGGPGAGPGGSGAAVTRSEEELRVGVRTRLRRLRLRKYVVTEYVTRTIPVRRERLRFEEAGTDLAAPADAGEATADQQAPLELVLHREEPVIDLRVVPFERVRVHKQVVTEQRTLTEQLRKEQVEVHHDPPRP